MALFEIQNTHFNNLPLNYILDKFNNACMLNEPHQNEPLVGWFMAMGMGAWLYWNGL